MRLYFLCSIFSIVSNTLQLRIRVECAFRILVQKWAILRTAMPRGIALKKVIALVNALMKLHNFCIEQTDLLRVGQSSAIDQMR